MPQRSFGAKTPGMSKCAGRQSTGPPTVTSPSIPKKSTTTICALKKQEELFAEQELEQEIEENANGPVIDIEGQEIDPVMEAEPENEEEPEPDMKPEAEQEKGQQSIGGPGF